MLSLTVLHSGGRGRMRKRRRSSSFGVCRSATLVLNSCDPIGVLLAEPVLNRVGKSLLAVQCWKNIVFHLVETL